MPDAWNDAAVGTAALDLRAKEEMLVNDRVEGLVLSTNWDLKSGSTSGLDNSELALDISGMTEPSERGLVEGSCIPICSPPKSSAISLLEVGLSDDPLSFFKGCGLAARKPLAEEAPASRPGPLTV